MNCHIKQSTPSRHSGTPQRDRVGREVRGGLTIGGTHIYLWLIHADILQKLSQYCKVMILLSGNV